MGYFVVTISEQRRTSSVNPLGRLSEGKATYE